MVPLIHPVSKLSPISPLDVSRFILLGSSDDELLRPMVVPRGVSVAPAGELGADIGYLEIVGRELVNRSFPDLCFEPVSSIEGGSLKQH